MKQKTGIIYDQTGALKLSKFALANEPTMYQLTIHKDNYDATYGENAFINQLSLSPSIRHEVVSDFINHYGLETISYFVRNIIGHKTANIPVVSARRSGAGVRKLRNS